MNFTLLVIMLVVNSSGQTISVSQSTIPAHDFTDCLAKESETKSVIDTNIGSSVKLVTHCYSTKK
jgi:hypothetical protein